MEEKSLQMELKIAKRDDVIEFPLLINPLIHIPRNTHTQRHRYTETEAKACMHTVHTMILGREESGPQS